MFKFHAVQAEEGDSLLLEYGQTGQPHFILVDGGPKGVYKNHLRGVLAGLPRRELELVMLSHVDNDHAMGLVDLFSELQEQQVNGQRLLVEPKALWHNAFSQTVTEEVQTRLASALASAPNQAALQSTAGVLQGVNEGSKLRGLATALKVPVNPGFKKSPITVDSEPGVFKSENLKLKVVGPTQANLDKLQTMWTKWLDDNEEAIANGEIEPLKMVDKSVPNLSSISVVAEADGHTVLLTGDGRGDFLIEGLRATGYLPASGGRAHFDCLKLPHHGSHADVDPQFFEVVTADHYVISANGRYDNPDEDTMEWLLQAAKKQNRKFTLHVTNNPTSVQQFVSAHPPQRSGYTLKLLPQGEHVLTLELA